MPHFKAALHQSFTVPLSHCESFLVLTLSLWNVLGSFSWAAGEMLERRLEKHENI